jgi:multicomponent Na+:H+ antiporter subunit D
MPPLLPLVPVLGPIAAAGSLILFRQLWRVEHQGPLPFVAPLTFIFSSGAMILLVMMAMGKVKGAIWAGLDLGSAMGPPLGVVITLGTCAIILYSAGILEPERDHTYYYSLVLAAEGGLVGIGFSNNLFTTFLFLELVSLCLYPLVSYGRRTDVLTAQRTQLITSEVGSALFLLGLSYLYLECGTLSRAGVEANLGGGSYLLSLSLILTGLGVKSALVPFDSWLPQVGSRTSTPVAALIALSTCGSMAAMVQVLVLFPPEAMLGVVTFALASLTVANVRAAKQAMLDRLLAHLLSMVQAQVLLGAALAVANGSELAMTGTLFHLYSITLLLVTAVLGVGGVTWLSSTTALDQLKGVYQRARLPTIVATIALLGISGVPPLTGFYGPIYIAAGAHEGATALWVVGALLLINLAFTFTVTIRVVTILFLPDIDRKGKRPLADLGGHQRAKKRDRVLRTPALIAIGIMGGSVLLISLAPGAALEVARLAAHRFSTGGLW